MYHIEEIFCEQIKKNIAEIISIDKKFIPFYNHPDTGDIMIIKDVYEQIHYSRALSSLLDIAYEKYKEFKGD